jgi:hypothetical protein
VVDLPLDTLKMAAEVLLKVGNLYTNIHGIISQNVQQHCRENLTSFSSLAAVSVAESFAF